MAFDVAEALRQFQRLEEDRANLQQEIEELRGQVKRVRSAEQAAERAREQSAALKRALAREQAHNDELEREVRNLRAQLADLTAKLAKAEHVAELVAEREAAGRELESLIGESR